MNSSAGTAKNTSSPASRSCACTAARPIATPEHAGDLRVVAAAMGRAAMRVGERMVGGAQAVELADEGEARPRRAAADAALDAGQRQAGLRFEAERAHRVGDQRGGFRFVEAGLRVVQDRARRAR